MTTETIEFNSFNGQYWSAKTDDMILAEIKSLGPDVDSVCFTNVIYPGGGSEYDWKSFFAALPDSVTSISLNHNPARQASPSPIAYFMDDFIEMVQQMKETIKELNIGSMYFETLDDNQMKEFLDELGSTKPGVKKLGIDVSKEYLNPDRTAVSITEKNRVRYINDMKVALSDVPSNIEVLDLSGPDNSLFFSKLTDDELIAIFQPLKGKNIPTVQLYERFAADHPAAFKELRDILNQNNTVLIAGTSTAYPKPLVSMLLKTLFESPDAKEQDSEPPTPPTPH